MAKIHPYLISFRPVESVHIDEKTWATDFEVVVGDANIANEYKSLNPIQRIWARISQDKFYNPDGRLGYFFYMLSCSPNYIHSDNHTHSSEDISKALVQNVPDHNAVKKYLEEHIDKIGNSEADMVREYLNKFLDATDWYEDDF